MENTNDIDMKVTMSLKEDKEVLSVVIPATDHKVRYNYNPKTGEWKKLIGWNCNNQEVWDMLN